MLLMEACLWHPDQLVRVAAAASSMAIRREPQRPLDILAQGTLSDQPLVAAVAATALADAVRQRENLPLVLTILADIGDMRLEPLFREFSTDEEAPVAQAARQGLETVRLRAHAPEARP